MGNETKQLLAYGVPCMVIGTATLATWMLVDLPSFVQALAFVLTLALIAGAGWALLWVVVKGCLLAARAERAYVNWVRVRWPVPGKPLKSRRIRVR